MTIQPAMMAVTRPTPKRMSQPWKRSHAFQSRPRSPGRSRRWTKRAFSFCAIDVVGMCKEMKAAKRTTASCNQSINPKLAYLRGKRMTADPKMVQMNAPVSDGVTVDHLLVSVIVARVTECTPTGTVEERGLDRSRGSETSMATAGN